MDQPGPLGWHVICGEELLGALRRCGAGEDPDLVYIELCANAERREGGGWPDEAP
jgi:hypothetical protein